LYTFVIIIIIIGYHWVVLKI